MHLRQVSRRPLRMSALTMAVTAVLLVVVAVAASPYRVTTETECEAYLCKYGYTYSLSCACPPEMAADTRVMPSAQWRQEHAAQSRDTSVSAAGGGGNTAASSRGASVKLRTCIPAEFAAALAVFQRTNHLAVTGVCDADTRSLMSSARCGVVDDYAAASGSGSDWSTVAPHSLALTDSDGRDDEDAVGESDLTDVTLSVALAAVAQSNKGPGPMAADRPQEASGRPSQIASDQPQEASGRPATLTVAAASLLGDTAQQPWNSASLRSLLAPNSGAAGRGATKISQLRPQGVPAGGGSVGKKRLPGRPQLEVGRRTAEKSKATLEALGGGSGHRVRPKRSTEIASSPPVSPWVNRTKPIRWRIVRYANRPSASEQDIAMEQAFRRWAAVIPLCFLRDMNSDVRKLDVVIGFFEGPHGGDFRQFDGYGGEIAHTYPMQFIHFDAAESWTVGGPGSSTGYNLLPAAIHEFGHLLGLSNSPNDNSVMNSLYSDRRHLSDEDVAAVSALYGLCSGRFDAVVDVVFSEDELDDHGFVVARRYYSTIFFRGSMNWLYKNARKRPMEGEPMTMSNAFSGLPNSLDAVVQHSLRKNVTNGSFVDTMFAFKGSHVYVYEYRGRRVLRSGAISSFFPSGSENQTIPNNIDSAYFDPRDGNIYFFKDDLVYAYHYQPDAQHSCCVFIRRIIDIFPVAQNAVGAVAQPPSYRRNLDAAYVSIRDESLYLIKGEDVWVTGNVRGPQRTDGTPPANAMRYDGHWNQRWRYICETDC